MLTRSRLQPSSDQLAEARKTARDLFQDGVELARSRVHPDHVDPFRRAGIAIVPAWDRYRQAWRCTLYDDVMGRLAADYADVRVERQEQPGLLPGERLVRYVLTVEA